MRKLTQTTFGMQGNCWQTAVACVLDVDPETLPDQSVCDQLDEGGRRKEPYFGNVLRAYLRDHHGLTTVRIDPSTVMSVLTPKDPDTLYFMSGPTVRTGTPGGAPSHIVIAQRGEMVWDTHPSRAGLTKVEYVSFLVPFPPEWDRGSSWNPCVCPACAGKAAA